MPAASHKNLLLAGGVLAALVLLVLVAAALWPSSGVAKAAPAAVLTVTLTPARMMDVPLQVPATGNVSAWQEASIGAESNGLKLVDVRVNVGDTVRKGQVLAVFEAAMVSAELAEATASVALARAQAADARRNQRRAQELDGSGAMSPQVVGQYVAEGQVAQARLEAAQAVEQRQRLRLSQARVVAPGDGVISARAATVGAVVPAGQELFRLIRDGRLEWRAVVATDDLDRLQPGQPAQLSLPGQFRIGATVRMVSPVVDATSHTGLVYLDLPADSALRAGAFATGDIEVGRTRVLTVPQEAVLLRDGFHYVMQVGPAATVVERKITAGQRIGDRVVVDGLREGEAVIASGLGFLGSGDTVHVRPDRMPAARTRVPITPLAAAQGNRP